MRPLFCQHRLPAAAAEYQHTSSGKDQLVKSPIGVSGYRPFWGGQTKFTKHTWVLLELAAGGVEMKNPC
jgi:hypothetical protein